jgi:hypothetical protein
MKAKRKFKDVRRKDRDKERKRKKQVVLSIVLAVLMMMSLGGIFLGDFNSSIPTEFEYNDVTFELTTRSNQQVFVSEISGREIIFYSLPQDVLRFDVNGNLTQAVAAEYLILSANHDPQLNPLYDLMRFDFNRYGDKLAIAGILEENKSSSLPVVTCENATLGAPVIEFRLGNQTIIDASQAPCIQIETRLEEAALMRDRLLFSMLGIIQR